ncbi:MAG TPA: hypothetical protein VGG39_27905 [Polyangiaceae bacterium]|jgi:hypothetical protein
MRVGMLPCLFALAFSACAYNPLLPDVRTPADRAREMSPRCRGFAEDAASPLLARATIDSVEPAYSYVQSGPGDREARLRGARIHVRPLPGLSRESIARALECHESRVVLGEVAASEQDPYVLAGHWLDVDADSEGDGFVVQVEPVETADVGLAREVLARARRFVSP